MSSLIRTHLIGLGVLLNDPRPSRRRGDLDGIGEKARAVMGRPPETPQEFGVDTPMDDPEPNPSPGVRLP